MKRYKAVLITSGGPRAAIIQADDEKEAEAKALATLEEWEKPVSVSVVEVDAAPQS